MVKKITSSFKMHKKLDVPMIRYQKAWKSRLSLLKDTINKNLITIHNKELHMNIYFIIFFNS